MKKGCFYLLIILVSLGVVGCENQFSNTPDEDTTQLWPAGDSTGFWGFINEKGEMVIPAKFERTYGFSGGMAKVVLDDDDIPMPPLGYQQYYEGHQQAFIDIHGNILFSLPNDKVFYDNYFYYGCCRYGGNSTRGLMNNHFVSIIPDEKFDLGIHLGLMTKDGLASSKIGYFNKDGEQVISCYINGVNGDSYEKLCDFYDGIAVVGYNNDLKYKTPIYDRCGAINTKGELVIDTVYQYLQSVGNDRLLYRLKGGDRHVGLMNTRGNIITEPFIINVSESFFGDGGLMPVIEYENGVPSVENRKYGYIDINGTLQIPYQYVYAEPFCNGYAWVLAPNEKNQTVYKLINLQGQVVLELDVTQWPASHISGNYHNGLCLIMDQIQDQYWYHYINLKGDVIYSWPEEPVNQQNSVSREPEYKIPDFRELMLQRFEGTTYYPLALQCALMND